MIEVRFLPRSWFNPKNLLKVVKDKKKTYLWRAGKYLLTAARRNIGERPQLKEIEFPNRFGVQQREMVWEYKAKVGHSPYDHPTIGRPSWKKSFRYAVDEAAEVVYVGAIKGNSNIAPLHEFGGTRKVEWTEFSFDGTRKIPHTFSKNVTFGLRETMRPALERSKDRISTFWKGVITHI